MTKLTLSKLTPMLMVSALFACMTIAKSPIIQEHDATVAADVCEAGLNDGLDVEAESAVVSTEDASINDAATIVVDNTPVFIDYIYTAMKSWIPPKDQCYWDPDQTKYQKCIDDADDFYRKVATTIVEVISEPDIKLPFIGTNIKVKSALLMTSIASTESRFQKKVDNCQIVGDNGIAFGLWQTHTSRAATCNDRKSALRKAIEIVMISFDYCKNYPLVDRLAAYASGSCTSDRGKWHSRRKMNRAMEYLRANPFTDSP